MDCTYSHKRLSLYVLFLLMQGLEWKMTRRHYLPAFLIVLSPQEEVESMDTHLDALWQ